MRECSHVVLAGMSPGLRALLDVATDASKACRDAARAAYPSSGASEDERAARALAAATATRHAVDAGLSAARVEHAITHMRGIRPDIVANDTTNASARMLLETKTAALCPSNYGTRFATNGDTWMEARAQGSGGAGHGGQKARRRGVFPNVQPPPMATQLQNLSGVSAIVVGASCEHNDQVHSLVDLLATAKAEPGAETETGLDNKSAVAFEKHRIRLRMAAGAWHGMAWHGASTTNLFTFHARLPYVRPLLYRQRSCPRGCAAHRRAPGARGAQPRPALHLWCARGGGRAPPRTKLAALRSGVPAFSGLRGLYISTAHLADHVPSCLTANRRQPPIANNFFYCTFRTYDGRLVL
jgi:hypothetical protein